jgi:RsiW-degrading membrane proteinase PrsW (M82 family)
MVVLLLLILISALPVIVAFLWFRYKKFPVPAYWFLLCLLAGALSPLPAAGIQYFIPPAISDSIKSFFFNVFIRIAFTEEGSKLLVLLPLLWLGNRLLQQGRKNFAYGTAAGLVTGLGFALIEGVFYGASDMRIALLRAFTAAPLHGACGARVGTAAVLFKDNPRLAILRFLSATAIHGTYNILVVSPGYIRFLSILLSFTSLLSATELLRKKESI